MYTHGISIIIPTYNEEQNIAVLIRRIVNTMQFSEIPYEIIFVDDHSTDHTRERIRHRTHGYEPVRLLIKQGEKGKGYSILEGFRASSYDHIAMLDADLQYPPEILPQMFSEANNKGFAVANRKTYKGSWMRSVSSRVNAFVFGRLLLNLPTDVQSGLKLFPREVFDHLDPILVSPWAIDIPLVYTAYELGLKEGHVDIDFEPRVNGVSKVRFFSTSWQIAKGALQTKLSGRKIRLLAPTGNAMLGSGIAYKRKRFVTHSMLPLSESALVTMTSLQKTFVALIVASLTTGLLLRPLGTIITFVAILSAIYFIDVLFNLFVVLKSLHFPPEISITEDQIKAMDESKLPVYSILCPLYREAEVLPQFIDAIEAIDWPKNKLDVLLLLEEDDTHTIAATRLMNLPEYMRIVVVPHSLPKTKPKACNYGLSLARGEYIVVYDAEDKPDPMQLKKAYLAFAQTPAKVVCLQAKLNYYNPHHNLLTRLFTAEYSLWFDVVLPGLQSIGTTIPLGGTSNHFRTNNLIALHGWDPFNVTEDCDLGARLFKSGYQTAIIDSTTLEEANSDLKNWFRQRSRWIKGYFQTYLVHMRSPVRFIREHGGHAFIFQLIVGGKIAFMLINPFLWIITISYFVLHRYVGAAIESIYPPSVFYIAVFSLVFGNFICLYNYMIGVAKRGNWDLVKYIYIIPFYWLMISWGAVIALWQLLVKPHYWEKTIHGFHISIDHPVVAQASTGRFGRITDLIGNKFVGGGILVAASLTGNILNFIYNSYLGRKVSIEEFGVISLIGSFVYMSQVPLGALSRAMTQKSAYLFGQYQTPVKKFWRVMRDKSYFWAASLSLVWVLAIPGLQTFFKTGDTVPFLLFTPVWFISCVAAVDSGFLGGNFNFRTLALLLITEAGSKLLLSYLFITNGLGAFVYAAIPLSMLVSFTIGWIAALYTKETDLPSNAPSPDLTFPRTYYGTSVLMTLTSITYLSLDIVLAKHYLTPVEAGQYSFLSLIGKMVYFFGTLFSGFIIPVVSRDLGAGKKSESNFLKLLMLIVVAHLTAFIAFGLLGYISVPILWGSKAAYIIRYLPMYTFSMVAFSLSGTIIAYHQVRAEYEFPIVGFILGFVQVVAIILFHGSIAQITDAAVISASFMLIAMIIMDRFYSILAPIYRNTLDLFGLFGTIHVAQTLPAGKKRILIFNWRDLRHVWAGGAEVYIHELSKRWVRNGHEVTVFCGDDHKSNRYETIDGVRIIRRGGFYTVYFWAFVYYQRFFKHKFDVIIDSENGIPFFTPLYAKEKIFLLIHHVHQEVFRLRLRPPLSWIGLLLERRLMPFMYRNTEVITVSPSSKEDILTNKLTARNPYIVYNGVDTTLCTPGIKSENPMILYLGRLTSTKSIHVLLKAAQQIIEKVPQISFVIAGDGPEKHVLQSIVHTMGLEKYVTFTGRVSQEEKVALYQKAWVFVNPSRIEGWGITTIEANACGTPVVASRVQGLRDAVRNPHTGFLVQYGNSDEFANRINQLLTDKELRDRMSKESVEWAQQFNWDKSAKESLDILSL